MSLRQRLRAAIGGWRSGLAPHEPAAAAPEGAHAQRLAELRALAAKRTGAASTGEGAERTAEHWGRDAQERQSALNALRYWTSHPVTAREINRAISGDPEVGWVAHLKRCHFAVPARRGISLGCGGGAVVTDAALLGITEQMLGVDISAQAVELARQRAAQAGVADRVDFRVADLNRFEPEGPFDLVLFEQSLHHVADLDAVLDRCQAALAPRGLFVITEYVGADRFQWSDEANRLMNALLELLPRRLRVDPVSGHEKLAMQRPRPEDVIAVDPSEAIHSSRILRACGERFELAERRDFGGTLLQFMLADIVAAFDPDDEAETALLRLMTLFERELIRCGALASDFVYAVYRSRR
jgi:2-polyprenyl-3-methyl-5-hydroxy-6-metoxy-1,4-benzoquinol methylase